MKHGGSLRMQRACHLLAGSKDKIETIAHQVGDNNPFTLSSSFKKWMGGRPSGYRTSSPHGKTISSTPPDPQIIHSHSRIYETTRLRDPPHRVPYSAPQ